MAKVGQDNIMKVELAIQRELDYRKKVANLFQSDEYINNLMPLQVLSSVSCPSPDPSVRSWPEPRSVATARPPSSVATARPCMAPGSSHHVLPTSNPNLAPSSAHQFLPSNAPGFDPGPYQIPNQVMQLSSFTPMSVSNHNPNSWQRPRPRPTYQPTYSGMKRKTTSGFQQQTSHKPQPPQENYIVVDSSGNMFCKLCEVPCSGPFNLKQHLKGHKHKAKLQVLKINKKNGGEQGNKLAKCDLCQVLCPNEDALNMHYQGQKHKGKLQATETGQKNGDTATERPWCGLCQIWCMNEDCFNQHLRGQKHITRLYSMQEQEMAYEGRPLLTSSNWN